MSNFFSGQSSTNASQGFPFGVQDMKLNSIWEKSGSVFEILEERAKWSPRQDLNHDGDKLTWSTESTFLLDLRYVLKLDTDFRVLDDSFRKQLQELFIVPKLHQLHGNYRILTRNELLAAFIIFLVQLLHLRKSYSGPFKDEIDSTKKELRFIDTVLNDTPLQGTEFEEVQDLMAQIESMANHAGSLVYSLFFLTDTLSRTHAAFDTLSVYMDRVKANTSILVLLRLRPSNKITPRISAMSSLFNVDSILYDLKFIINREDDQTVDLKGQIRTIHKGLIPLLSFLKSIEVPWPSEIEEVARSITDVAYGIEYLTTSYLVGDAPLWYITLRLPDVIQNIKVIQTEIRKVNKDYESGTLKPQLSLEPKINSEADGMMVGFEMKIISIFELDGHGKTTTLSKILCNHPSVIPHFHKSSWCIVTKRTDMGSVLTSVFKILEQWVEWSSRRDLIHDRDILTWSTDSKFLHDLRYVLNLDMKYRVLADFFCKQFQELFMVPKHHELQDKYETLTTNELLSAFIVFILQLLHLGKDFTGPFKDQIDSIMKELKFIVTVLNDTPLQGTEVEVQNLMEKIESMANDVGSLVYSLFFSRDYALSEHMDLVQANIGKLLVILRFLLGDYITPRTFAVSSLINIDPFLCDLEVIMNREDIPNSDVQSQIRTIHQGLISSVSFVKSIKVLWPSEIEEAARRINDVAYETEYLISSYLVGDAPLWYLIIRLADIIHNVKLIETHMLPKVMKNYESGTIRLAEDSRAQISSDLVVGFKEETTKILGVLGGGTKNLQIISIFGMAGLGKTTLAKKAYNDPQAIYYFDKRSWCVVTQTCDRRRVLAEILAGIASDLEVEILKEKEDCLGDRIYKSLKGRRYLIVMDDMWNLDVWKDLHIYFPNDGNGSRILLTSRIKDAAPDNSIIHSLSPLSDSECWELLEKKVFRNESCPSWLSDIGRQISSNCNGLPLAVVVGAGVLSTVDREEHTWKNVAQHLGSYISDDADNSVMQILELSYNHLPSHLKPCFLYLGAFPEDEEIPVTKLRWLWIAEGFIRKEERKSSESVAEEYLMELIDRSLIIVAKKSSVGGVKTCLIHDLLRDLCLRKADEENFLKFVINNDSVYWKHHHVCFCTDRSPKAPSQFLKPLEFHTRSLLGFGNCSRFSVSHMKLLRVLDLSELKSSDVELGLLVHLRYLAINQVPASVGSLVNLEFLLVKSKYRIAQRIFIFSSSGFLKLVKLRYLGIVGGTFEFNKDCDRPLWNNLEYLSGIRINDGRDVEMLRRCSPSLRKLKCKLEDSNNAPLDVDLGFLTHLESLKINCTLLRPKSINFPPNIKKLTLYGTGLMIWENISTIGRLSNLEALKLISYWENVSGQKWETSDGEFQQLRFLKLDFLRLVQWDVSSWKHFPKLRHLVLKDCRGLEEIPSEIGNIPTLQLIEVRNCSIEVESSALRIQQEQQEDYGNEDLRVIVHRGYK